MKKTTIKWPELLYILSYLIYLVGSAITHIEDGVELSLWLMSLAIVITSATTILPWLGFNWLRLEKKGCRSGWWLSLLLQIASWFVFAAAMFFRLGRNLARFQTLIILVTLLWSSWLLIFIYSRHACSPNHADDKRHNDIRVSRTPNGDTQSHKSHHEKDEK